MTTSFAVKSNGMRAAEAPASTSYYNPLFGEDEKNNFNREMKQQSLTQANFKAAAATQVDHRRKNSIVDQPPTSGVTRIYINHVSENIKDVYQRQQQQQHCRVNNLITLTAGNNANVTSCHKDFNLMEAKTQDAFTQMEMSQLLSENLSNYQRKNSDILSKAARKEEISANSNRKHVEFNDENLVDERKENSKTNKCMLEKSKTVIVNVTPQTKPNNGHFKSHHQEEEEEEEEEAAASNERRIIITSPTSLLNTNEESHLNCKFRKNNNNIKSSNPDLSSATAAAAAASGGSLAAQDETNKYDIKNDSTPVSITSNANKPPPPPPVKANMHEAAHHHQQQQPYQQQSEFNSDMNQNLIFSTQSSSYYNDVNNRFQMAASIPSGSPNSSDNNNNNNNNNTEVIRLNDSELFFSVDVEAPPHLVVINNKSDPDKLVNIDMMNGNENGSGGTSNNGDKICTFYNGRRVWKSSLNGGAKGCTISNGSYHKVEEEISKSSLQRKGSNLRKNLKVKIKLPLENMTRMPPKKERKVQKCCLVLFLLVLFVFSIGFLIYFFASSFIMKRSTLN
jgi:hypothetical protein